MVELAEGARRSADRCQLDVASEQLSFLLCGSQWRQNDQGAGVWVLNSLVLDSFLLTLAFLLLLCFFLSVCPSPLVICVSHVRKTLKSYVDSDDLSLNTSKSEAERPMLRRTNVVGAG